MRWQQSDRGRVLVKVHRVADGSLVNKDGLGTPSAGAHSWKWNGRNRHGEAVKPGKYHHGSVVRRRSSL